jgi:glycerol-3-phosphate acyltransferase PlsY
MGVFVVVIVLAYLAGSISSAVIVCRALGLGDPRQVGSGNPGTTNVLRNFGAPAAALTLAGDVLKGFLPVLLARSLDVPTSVAAWAALAAFVGHLFPVFFAFRGGKGVATYIGVVLALAWPLGVAFVALWLAVAVMSRYASLAALTAACITPSLALVLAYPGTIVQALIVMAALVVWRHVPNIRQLLRGTERRIAFRKPDSE